MDKLPTHKKPPLTGKKLAIASLILAFFVIALGAFTRLTDAGLGCPDWPGCYGRLIVPQAPDHIAQANAAYPQRPVEHPKAWAEMVHRYLAGSLGLCIFILTLLHFKDRTTFRVLTGALSLLVIGQAALGMWTVTLGLKPVIVMLHLIGGFSTFSLLLTLNVLQRQWPMRLHTPKIALRRWRPLFLVATSVLVIQIILGGWTAANYSANVCTELPICQGNWASHLNFSEALKFWGHDVAAFQEGNSAYEYGMHLTPDVKITIHIMHRFGALLATACIGLSVLVLWRAQRQLALGLLALLALQVSLGISNIVFNLPLLVAVAHNLVAVLLLGWHLMVLFYVYAQAHTLTTGLETHDLGTLQNRRSTTAGPIHSGAR